MTNKQPLDFNFNDREHTILLHDIFVGIVLEINKKRSLQSVRNVNFIALASDAQIPMVGSN
jgi:hypothetical protein